MSLISQPYIPKLRIGENRDGKKNLGELRVKIEPYPIKKKGTPLVVQVHEEESEKVIFQFNIVRESPTYTYIRTNA